MTERLYDQLIGIQCDRRTCLRARLPSVAPCSAGILSLYFGLQIVAQNSQETKTRDEVQPPSLTNRKRRSGNLPPTTSKDKYLVAVVNDERQPARVIQQWLQ